jgi:hypothetical protein
MHEIEEEVQPEILKNVNAGNSTAVGQTYTTAINLPSDFFLPAPYIYVGSERFYQVPLERAVDTAIAMVFIMSTLQTANITSAGHRLQSKS